jgi:hypothetical protein
MLINNEDILRVGGILLPLGESEPETQEPAGEASPWLAGVQTLALKDFTLVYHDATLDQRVYVDSLELSELKQWDSEAPARLEYRGVINDAAVELDAELAPFTQIPTYKGTVSVDKLFLTDFEPSAKPALAKLAGLVSVQGDFEVKQSADEIHVVNEGELMLEGVDIDQEQIRLTNQSLGWDGATDLSVNTASSRARVKGEGKLTSTGLATDLQEQKLKFAYQNFDLDVVFSYADSDSGPDIALNSDLLVSGLDLVAPEKKVDIISAQKLQLAGLEVKGPAHVSAEKITADELSLGRSLNKQDGAPAA